MWTRLTEARKRARQIERHNANYERAEREGNLNYHGYGDFPTWPCDCGGCDGQGRTLASR